MKILVLIFIHDGHLNTYNISLYTIGKKKAELRERKLKSHFL